MRALSQTLQDVRDRIAKNRGSRKLGEQNTKATLIEPVLRALGWDVLDVEEVQREFKVKRKDKPVDYALLVLRNPRLIVEAKALGEDLADRRWANQIMGYASVAGAEWVVLTNGDEWRIYNGHAAVSVDEKLFRTVKVSDGTPEVIETLELLAQDRMEENRIEVLWRAHFVDRQVRAAIEGLLEGPDAALVRLVEARTRKLTQEEVRSSLTRCQARLDFPLDVEVAARSVRKKRGGGSKAKASKAKAAGVSPSDLIAAGYLNPPVPLHCTYKKKHLSATILPDGRVRFGREMHDSLSTAAGYARATIIGAPPGRKYPQTNGWTFWKIATTGGDELVDAVRQRFIKGDGSGPKLRLVSE